LSAGSGKSVAILPERGFALKLVAMSTLDRLRAAWDCKECRFYRRAALVVGGLALCSWLLL
jgi:hypothetical protein